jgi:acyl homoserine lactone synthase
MLSDHSVAGEYSKFKNYPVTLEGWDGFMTTVTEYFKNISCDKKELEIMYRIRKNVFLDRLGWDVLCSGGLESDAFDNADCDYLVVRHKDALICSCRLIPTTRPTMLSEVFPGLLRGEDYLPDPAVIEISRLAATACPSLRGGVMSLILRELRRYASDHRVSAFVFVTTTAIERLLRRHGVRLQRFGDGRTTLVGGVRSVALRLHPADIPQVN